jgi:hypothetical protein
MKGGQRVLEITIPGEEFYNEETEEFFEKGGGTLQLEHSLVSLSKWEMKFEKPFLGPKEKTPDEMLWYIQAMVITPDFSPEVFSNITDENLLEVNKYISAKMTATWFAEEANRRHSRETITAELIYAWMANLHIPFECQYWHLNRLLTLVRVCSELNAPKKKMTPQEAAAKQRTLNAQRKAKLGTTG